MTTTDCNARCFYCYEKGIKKLGYYLILPFFSSAWKKAKKKFPEIEDIVYEYISEQNALEKQNCAELDRAADQTAKALAKILMLCSSDQKQKRVLQRLGYCMGRYIYLLDAACDLESDIKKGSYNVLKGSDIKQKAIPQIYFCINEACKAFELLDIKKYNTILGNIIYLGLEDTFKKELDL